MPNWEQLYRSEVSSHLLTTGALNAERQLREQDRQYANREYHKLMTTCRELRVERDTIAAAYRALLDTLNKPRQPRKATTVVDSVDLSNMSDEQIRQYIIDHPGEIGVKA